MATQSPPTATATYGSSIRSSGNYHARDSWQLAPVNLFATNFYTANKPTNLLVSLSPLFSSTNNQKDIDSITRRLQGSHGFGPLSSPPRLFPESVTNAPTISAGSASKTIGNIFMNDTASFDEMGIRGTSGGNLVYTNGQTTRLFGSGIMNKPIGDFPTPEGNNNEATFSGRHGAPFFGRIHVIHIHGRVIPEPEEYALVFGLFALAFVIVRRHFQKKGIRVEG